MENEPSFNRLKSHKAAKSDWKEILKLLDETKLSYWFSGNENHKNFYVVKNQSSKKIIGCFAIYSKGKIGILKSFAVRKNTQNKGLGKYIIDNILPIAGKQLGLKKIYGSSYKSAGFWGSRSHIKEVDPLKIKDKYFLEYISYLNKNYPHYTKKNKHFLLRIK